MARLNLQQMDETNNEQTGEELDELIPAYGENKAELDKFKKICDSANSQIKDLMFKAGEDEHESDGWVAKRIVAVRETMNEEKLLAILRKHKVDGIIKTREYVDMEALEAYLYVNEPSEEFATDLAKCKETSETVQLRISKAKKKKAEV